jgi:hypothetical protein
MTDSIWIMSIMVLWLKSVTKKNLLTIMEDKFNNI